MSIKNRVATGSSWPFAGEFRDQIVDKNAIFFPKPGNMRHPHPVDYLRKIPGLYPWEHLFLLVPGPGQAFLWVFPAGVVRYTRP